MIKRFYYIILLLVLVPFLSFAAVKNKRFRFNLAEYRLSLSLPAQTHQDTIINRKSKKERDEDEKDKIKEIAKAKKQTKPEKVTDEKDEPNKKKKQRRPEGLERPPEIFRRNGG